MSLGELFVQILKSEQKAEERKSVLNDIKTKIRNTRIQLGKVQEQKSSLQGQLLLKTKKLSEEELNLKWYTIRENVLKKQLIEVKGTKERRLKELSNVREKQEKEMRLFNTELEKFNQEYDLQGNGVMERQRKALTKIEELKKQEQQLSGEMSKYREHKRILNELTEEKEAMIKEINEWEIKSKDLDEELQKEEEEINKLEMEKNEVANKAHSCPEFKRFQNELESCQDDALESVCAALQLELDQLQQSLWQKKLQNKSIAKHKQPPNNSTQHNQIQSQEKSMNVNNRRHGKICGPKQSCFKGAPPTKTPATFNKFETNTSEEPKPNLKKLRQEMQKKNHVTQTANFDLQLDSLLEGFEDLDEIQQDIDNDETGVCDLKSAEMNSSSSQRTPTITTRRTVSKPTVSKKVRFK